MYLRKTIAALVASTVFALPAFAIDAWSIGAPRPAAERAKPKGKAQTTPVSSKTQVSQPAPSPYADVLIKAKSDSASASVKQVNETAVKILQRVSKESQVNNMAVMSSVNKSISMSEAKVERTREAAANLEAKVLRDHHALNNRIETVDRSMKVLQRHVNDSVEKTTQAVVDSKDYVKSAGAISVAMSNLSYDFKPHHYSVSVGFGVFESRPAVAFGVAYALPDPRLRANFAAAYDRKIFALGAGLTYSFQF